MPASTHAEPLYRSLQQHSVFGIVCCTQEHDGDDPFYIREFHISMRHYVY